jgi:hypothetical protein
MQTWRNVPDERRAAWGEGPWANEPDKAQWVDLASGLDCLIVRNHLGALCGYAGVSPAHPLYGRDYNSAPFSAHEAAHGGLTYANGCRHSDDPAWGICHIPEEGRPDNVWWFGFDCGHLYDLQPAGTRDLQYFSHIGAVYRDWRYVQGCCTALAAALAEYKGTAT